MECNWCKDEICVNADCPICCDYCPVPDTEGVCKFEDRSERHFTVVEGRMKEYIERERLLQDIEHYHLSDGKFQHWVEIQPAADVAPVRHELWEKRGSKWQCTGCKVLMSIDGTPQENLLYYCPNCGAKMDKKEE